jgi:hypothetical protein
VSRAEEVLAALGDGPLYAVLDGARDSHICAWIRATRAPAWCLYAGKLEPALEECAPWLLRLGRGHRYVGELFEMGFGNAWGFFFTSEAPQRALRRQLRQNLLATTEAGRRLVFRYYDPRVLRAYLPTCTEAELRKFLGPIASVAIEREDGEPPLIVRHPDGVPARAPLTAPRGQPTW